MIKNFSPNFPLSNKTYFFMGLPAYIINYVGCWKNRRKVCGSRAKGNLLNTQIVNLKWQGKEIVKHKLVIEPEDSVKLKSSNAITVTNPLSLLQNIWFRIVLYFCRRWREGQRNLRKSSFKFEQDGKLTSGKLF